MRKEHVVFFSLILAAAITAGSTLSLANNAQALAEYKQTRQTQKNIETDEENTPNETSTDVEASHDKKVLYRQENISRGSDEFRYIYISNENKPVSLTDEEKKQVIAMLKELGMSSEDEYSVFLRDFQQKHNILPTGTLDTFTLELIINQVQIERAFAQIKAAHKG